MGKILPPVHFFAFTEFQATDRDLQSSSTRRKANAWMCARRATDRYLESKRCEKVTAWICASLTTDRDPASVIPDIEEKI